MEILCPESKMFYACSFDFEELGYLPHRKQYIVKDFTETIGMIFNITYHEQSFVAGPIQGHTTREKYYIKLKPDSSIITEGYTLGNIFRDSKLKYKNHIQSTYSGQASRYADLAKKIRKRQCKDKESSSRQTNTSSMRRWRSLGASLRRMSIRKRYVLRGIL